jgi:hypothetical protein
MGMAMFFLAISGAAPVPPDLHRYQTAGVDLFDPVYMLFVIFHRVHAVEWKGGEESISGNGFPHLGDRRGHLIAQKMSPQSGFGALRILEFNDANSLNRFLPHAEEPGRHLRDHVVVIRLQEFRVPPLTGAGKGIPSLGRPGSRNHGGLADGSKRHPAAVKRHRDPNHRPLVASPIQGDGSGDLFIVFFRFARRSVRKTETKPIKPAFGFSNPIFQVAVRDLSGLGLLPG